MEEQLLGEAFDATPMGLLVFDQGMVLVRANRRARELLRAPESDRPGTALAGTGLCRSDGSPLGDVVGTWSARLAEVPRLDLELGLRRGVGEVIQLHGRLLPLAGAEGRSPRRLLAFDEATLLPFEHDALPRALATLAEAQAIAMLGTLERNLVTNEVVISPEFKRLMGFEANQPVDLGLVLELIHIEDRLRVAKWIQSVPAPGEVQQHDFRVRGQNGVTRFIHTRRILRTSAKGEPVVHNTMRDVSERHYLEQQLRLADRMASVGALSASIAHEINNPLAYMLSSIELLRRGLAAIQAGKPQPIADLLDLLNDTSSAADKVLAITRDLRTFARHDDAPPTAVSLPEVVESAVSLARHEIRHRAKLVVRHGDVPQVRGNAGRLGQVLLNLLINSAQAIAEGAPDKNEIRVETRRRDERVVIEVTDTGCGIPAALLPQIFDPFFTTKPAGVGTGLGLAICRTIVSELGGELVVDSVVDRGSTFLVLLPVWAPPAS